MAKPPVHVTVTGAGGQIGYSILFRIASGQLLGEDQPIVLRLLEIEPAMKRARGRRHGARRLRLPAGARHRRHLGPQDRLRRHVVGAPRRLHPAQGRHGARRPAQRERRDLQAAGPGHRRERRLRRAHPRRRQPVQHELPHRPLQRTRGAGRPLVRHDPPRREPGQGAAGRQGRRAGGRRHQRGHLGQPLGHAVPRLRQRPHRRQAGAPTSSPTTSGCGATSSRRCRSGARPSSTPGARPRRPRRPPRPSTPWSACAPRRAAGRLLLGRRVPAQGQYGAPEGLQFGFPVGCRRQGRLVGGRGLRPRRLRHRAHRASPPTSCWPSATTSGAWASSGSTPGTMQACILRLHRSATPPAHPVGTRRTRQPRPARPAVTGCSRP